MKTNRFLSILCIGLPFANQKHRSSTFSTPDSQIRTASSFNRTSCKFESILTRNSSINSATFHIWALRPWKSCVIFGIFDHLLESSDIFGNVWKSSEHILVNLGNIKTQISRIWLWNSCQVYTSGSQFYCCCWWSHDGESLHAIHVEKILAANNNEIGCNFTLKNMLACGIFVVVVVVVLNKGVEVSKSGS